MVTSRRFSVLSLLCLLAILATSASAATYYVDPTNGSDSNDGSSATPWETIAKAMTTVSAGDTVNLQPGDYGTVDFSTTGWATGTSWAAPIVVQGDPGSTAYGADFEKINFQGGSYYIRLKNLKVTGDVNAGIYLGSTNYVEMIDLKIHGEWGGTAGPYIWAIYALNCDNLLVEDCEIYNLLGRGVEYSNCTNSTVRGTYVHDLATSALRTGGGSNLLFEYNVVENQHPDWSPGVHGSGFSMHSSDTTLRGNIVKNFGNSRAIRWYQDVAGDYGYSNLLIENNLAYDHYAWAPEFVDMGSNCVFRNNTFIDGATIKFAKLVDGSGLSLYNNVATGNLRIDNFGSSATLNSQTRAEATAKWANINEGNNIIDGLCASGGGYLVYEDELQSGDGNLVLKDDNGNYKTGYDSTYLDLGKFFLTIGGAYPYQLTSTASAIGFADATNAPSTDLAEATRDANPDAGAYEYTGASITAPVADAGADQSVTDTDDSGDESITLDGSGSSDSDGTIESYIWKEGDAGVATGVSPTLTMAVGVHTIDLLVIDDDGAGAVDTVVITVVDPGPGGPFVQDDGTDKLVSMEAENYNTSVSGAGKEWEAVSSPAGASGDEAMQALPDYGAGTRLNYIGATAELTYQVDFVATGTHYVWVRAYKTGSGNDGVGHVGLNDTMGADQMIHSGTDNTWEWITDAQTINVATAGEHTVSLWMYEDGAIIDKIVLTTNANYTPTGTGPAETPRDNPNVAPIADAGADQTVNDTDDSGDEAVTLDGSASADSDGTISSYVWETNSTQIATGATPTVTLAVGSHTIDLTVTDDDDATDSDSVEVTVVAQGDGPFVQDSGTDSIVSIEAEFYDSNITGAGKDWTLITTPTGMSAGEAMQVQPDWGSMSRINYIGATAELTYEVDFITTGTYYVWVRAYSTGTGDDGVGHVGLNNTLGADQMVNTGSLDEWVWVTDSQTITVGATGKQTLSLWMYEDGGRIDKIVLTTNAAYVPTGEGPAQSMRGENAYPVADAGADQTVTDLDDDGSADVTLDGTASTDADGTIATYVWEETAAQIATGSAPTVALAVGSHTIDLTVTDDLGATDVDSVGITVNAPITLDLDDFDSQTLNAPFAYDDGTTVPVWDFGSEGFVEYLTGDYALQEVNGINYNDLRIGSSSTWGSNSRVTLPAGVTRFQFRVINDDPSVTKPAQTGRTLKMWWQGDSELFADACNATVTFTIPELAPGESATISIDMDDFIDDSAVFGSTGNIRWGKLELADVLSGTGSAAANVLFDDFKFIE